MPGPVLKQIWELLAHHVVCIPHIILGLARVVRLCAQGHLCPGNACSWRYTVSLNCLQAVNPACGVVSPPWEVWLCWHSLDFSVSLAYWWASPETPRMLMHGADICMSALKKAGFIVWTLPYTDAVTWHLDCSWLWNKLGVWGTIHGTVDVFWFCMWRWF